MPGEIKPNSVLLDLRLDAVPTDEVLVKKAKIHEKCQIVLFKIIIDCRLFRYQVSEVVDTLLGLKLTLLSTSSKATTRTLCLESPNGDVFVLIRVYPRESKKDKVLATVNLELPRPVDIDPEDTLRDAFTDFEEGNPDAMGSYPPLRRCKKDVPYLRSSGKMQKRKENANFANNWPILFFYYVDDRLLEYAYKEVLFSARSPFQLVQIVDTVDFGKLLLLVPKQQKNLSFLLFAFHF